MRRSKNTNSKKRPPVGMLVVVALLVAADLMYLYKLSNQAFFDAATNVNRAKDHHSPHKLFVNNIKGTHLSNLGDRLADIRNADDKNNNSPNAHVKDNLMNNNDGIRKTPTAEQLKLIRIAKDRGLRNVDDKGPILEILTQGGLDVDDKDDIDQETLDLLPTWTQVQNLYGSKPMIYGLERCEEFRNLIEPTERFFGMAGTFNTGTNLIADVMKFNCQITERMEVYGKESKGIRWQVPWGKHYMARYRGTEHSTKTDSDVPHDHTLPLVSIRDPYSWMQSMCRHKYAANWPHNKTDHCPNLIATEDDIKKSPILTKMYDHGDDKDTEKLVPVKIKYRNETTHSHLSLAHWYSEWYGDYWKADYPRIIVRFEDLLFHGKEVTRAMCHCGGGVPRPDNGRLGDFAHVSESAKKGTTAHGAQKERTNLVGALIKYSSFAHRTDSMTPDDLIAARRHLDPEIMKAFGYRHPPPPPPPPSKVDEIEDAATDGGRYDDDHSVQPEKDA